MSIIQQCPLCGNHVEGKRIQSYAKKVTKTGVKSAVNGAASVGAAGTGAAIGSAILPGVGTVIGAGLGLIGSAMFHTAVNDGIDKAADVVTDAEYEFTCPKCGHTWTGQEDDNYEEDDDYLPDDIETDFRSTYADKYPQLAQYFLNMFRKEYCQPSLSYDSAIDEAKTERALHKITTLFEDYPTIKESIFFNWQHRKEHSGIWHPVNNIKDVVGFCVMVIVNTPDRFEREEEELYFFNKYIVPYCRPNTQPSTPVYMALPNVYQILDALKKDGITVDPDSYADCMEEMADYDNIFDWSDYILLDEKKQITYPQTTTVATCKKNINRIVCGLIGGPIFVDVAVPDTTNPAEQEYLDELRSFLEDDAEITPRERKMLDRHRQKLGISEERAKELEASLAKPQLTEDEQEYFDELREVLEDDGEITPRERKLLERHRQKLGISEERAKELEKMV